MIRSDQILKTVDMIQKENLDVRAVTMGISRADANLIAAVPEALATTSKVCSSINAAWENRM